MNPTADASPEVRTSGGLVRGVWRGTSAAFLGIPYAEPPIGELRFAAPVPHRPWEGVRDAATYGPTPQRETLAEITLIPEPSIPGESTLSVNVFTPSPRRAAGTHGLPVLVYIHGGGFVAGSPASPWYDGAAFNRDGVVLVTLSYRLGFDGFGWIADAPMNRAVLDWLLALEWVQQNVAEFGGDPAQVTIAGQSAGGTAVLTLLAMPRAQHLFAGAWCLSGATRDGSLARAERCGRALATLGGVDPTRAGLSTLAEATVLDLQKRVPASGDLPIGGTADGLDADPVAELLSLATVGITWCPVVDGELVPMDTVAAFRAGVGADKPLVLGTTDHEFRMAAAGVRDILRATPAGEILVRAGLDAATAAGYVADHADLDTPELLGQYVTDALFRAPAVGVAVARSAPSLETAQRRAPTWLYRFSWRSPTFGDAVHCIDVPFFFDCLTANRVDAIAGSTPPQPLADDMHASAVAFIRDGAPDWSPWSTDDGLTCVFDVPSTVMTDGYRDVRSLLAGVLPTPLSPTL